MKKFGLLVTMIFVSSLLFTGCGNSSNGNGLAEDEDRGPIVVIPPVVGEDTGDDTGEDDTDGDTVGEAPDIKIIGKHTIRIYVGQEYIDEGATASDPEDEDITHLIVTVNSVDVNTVGTYTVTYTVEDSDGNTDEAVRTVIVEADLEVPVITLLGQNPQDIYEGTAYTELNATATDNVDGDISDQIVIDATDVNTSLVGNYTVTYNVTDSAGNTATEVTRDVNVILPENDAPPVITLLGANPQTVLIGNDYVEFNATAMDAVDGDISDQIVIDATDVDTSVEGMYEVTYTVTDSANNSVTEIRDVNVTNVDQPAYVIDDGITSEELACDTNYVPEPSLINPAERNASNTVKRNVSSTSTSDPNRHNPTSHNTPAMLDMVLPATMPDGTEDLNQTGEFFHPIVVSYTQQVVGDYETGDGSADIGDPEHVDGVFVATSLNNGNNWRRYTISNTSDKSSIQVLWDIDPNGQIIDYPGHAQKPTMAIEDRRVLIAWNDKYCPSGNPLELDAYDDNGVLITDPEYDGNKSYPQDYFQVNGAQGSIDYAQAQDGSREEMVAPNGKYVYEVPFSCVWTARGFVEDNGTITWHSPMQLTSGLRDSNHINLAASEAGFSILWHEDTVGLKSGKGAGPGEGWSGATTGHGTDIWYTSIKMADFDAPNLNLDVSSPNDPEDIRPQSLNNFHYPVRITDNEKCADDEDIDETKLYCQHFCDTYGSQLPDGGKDTTDIKRCLTYDIDMLVGTQAILDGDTGASRPALEIMKNENGQHIVVMGYEETKGLSLSDPGEPDQEQDGGDTNISVEGKSVYFESFLFDAIDDVDLSNDFADIMANARIPMVSAGNIVNIQAPDQETGEMIFENARRLVIGTQIDVCEADETGAYNFAYMYKQSFDTQGSSSDMFIKVNNGLRYDSFVELNGRTVTNVSAQVNKDMGDLNTTNYEPESGVAELSAYTYDNSYENTFSPRIFLRGNNIYTGFEYTPDENATAQEHFPSNFHTHIYRGDAGDDTGWDDIQNVTKVTKYDVTTVDARFFTTPKSSWETEDDLESDKSNPKVIFVTWGTVEGLGEERAEGDLFITRSTDDGLTWEHNASDLNASMLAARDGTIIQEKEVGSFTTPDGLAVYNVWLQEVEFEDYDSSDPFHGLDTWFGRVDYNITVP